MYYHSAIRNFKGGTILGPFWKNKKQENASLGLESESELLKKLGHMVDLGLGSVNVVGNTSLWVYQHLTVVIHGSHPKREYLNRLIVKSRGRWVFWVRYHAAH